VSPVEAALLLLAAGVVAGAVGSGSGVTSLVSYPALLGIGIPPLPANIANLVAGAAIAPGAALSSRRELANAWSVLIRLQGLYTDHHFWIFHGLQPSNDVPTSKLSPLGV
jgi:uncharacterized protein